MIWGALCWSGGASNARHEQFKDQNGTDLKGHTISRICNNWPPRSRTNIAARLCARARAHARVSFHLIDFLFYKMRAHILRCARALERVCAQIRATYYPSNGVVRTSRVHHARRWCAPHGPMPQCLSLRRTSAARLQHSGGDLPTPSTRVFVCVLSNCARKNLRQACARAFAPGSHLVYSTHACAIYSGAHTQV